MKLFGLVVLMIICWIVCIKRLPYITRERAVIAIIALTVGTVGLIYHLFTLH
jgi:hypothetical protein